MKWLALVYCLPFLISMVRRQPPIFRRWVFVLNLFGFTVVTWFGALALSLVGIVGTRAQAVHR